MAGYGGNIILSFHCIAGTPLRAFETSTADFLLKKSGRIQLHFKRLGNQPETKDKRAHGSIKHFY